MLNQLLRFTLVSSALLWLRPRWRGLLALVAFVVLVHVLHAEYLGYVGLSGNQAFLPWSYVIKWLALAMGLALYLLLALRSPQNGRRDQAPARAKKAAPAQPALPLEDDGFDFLREKKHLQNRAEKLLARNKR